MFAFAAHDPNCQFQEFCRMLDKQGFPMFVQTDDGHWRLSLHVGTVRVIVDYKLGLGIHRESDFVIQINEFTLAIQDCIFGPHVMDQIKQAVAHQGLNAQNQVAVAVRCAELSLSVYFKRVGTEVQQGILSMIKEGGSVAGVKSS